MGRITVRRSTVMLGVVSLMLFRILIALVVTLLVVSMLMVHRLVMRMRRTAGTLLRLLDMIFVQDGHDGVVHACGTQLDKCALISKRGRHVADRHRDLERIKEQREQGKYCSSRRILF